MPYKENAANVQETFNEWTVLVACYHLTGFTEWIYTPDTRYKIGWSLIGVIALNVMFNFSYLVIFVLRRAIRRAHLGYKRHQYQKYRQKYLQEKSRITGNTFLSLDGTIHDQNQIDFQRAESLPALVKDLKEAQLLLSLVEVKTKCSKATASTLN